MVESRVEGSMITVKLMKKRPNVIESKKYLGHGLADTFSASDSMRTASNDVETIYERAVPLFRRLTRDFKEGNDLRGLGVHLTKLKELYAAVGPMAPVKDSHSHSHNHTLTSPQKQKEISSFFKVSRNHNDDDDHHDDHDNNKSNSNSNSNSYNNDKDNKGDDNNADDDDDDNEEEEEDYLMKSLSDEEEELCETINDHEMPDETFTFQLSPDLRPALAPPDFCYHCH